MKKALTIIAMVAMAMAMQAAVFEKGNLKYSTITSATSSTNGTCTVAGLSAVATGESRLALDIPATVSYNGSTYNVVGIAASAFQNKTQIESLTTVNATNLQSIGSSAFSGCTKLTSVTTQALGIEGNAFSGCTALSNVSLKNGVKTVYGSAFAGCTALTTILFPKSVQSMSASVVDRCTALKAINVDEQNSYYSSHNGMLFNKAQTRLIRVPEGKDRDYQTDHSLIICAFPTTLVEIGDDAFAQCSAEEVRIPWGVKKIGASAFVNAVAMKTLIIPSSVNNIGNNAFAGCTGLETVVCNIPNINGITLGSYLFDRAATKTLFVPYGKADDYKTQFSFKAFSTIKNGAYDFQYGCIHRGTALMGGFPTQWTVIDSKEFTMDGITYSGKVELARQRVLLAGGSSTSHLPEHSTIDMPNSVDNNGKQFLVTRIGREVLHKGNDTYGSYYNITLKVSEYVDTIMANAFSNISNVDTLILNKNIKYIGAEAFKNSPIKNELILPYGINQINGEAFSGTQIKRIVLPSSANSLNGNVFKGLGSLEELYINNSWMANYTNWSLSSVPSKCKIFVPAEAVPAYKANSVFNTRTIMAGAYDFTREGYTCDKAKYLITVTSNNPVTVNGVRYDGKAKYVYNVYLDNTTSYRCLNSETDITYGGNKKYLMTAIGDSCLYWSRVATVDISDMTSLESIGNYAFSHSALSGNFIVPATVTYIGAHAFTYCAQLDELFLTQQSGRRSWGNQFYGGNAEEFKCFVKWTAIGDYAHSAMNWEKLGGTFSPDLQIRGYIESTDSILVVSLPYRAHWNFPGVTARIIPSIKGNKLITEKETVTSRRNGVLLTGVEPGKVYKVYDGIGGDYDYLLKGNPIDAVNVYNVTGGLYFNRKTCEFIRPTAPWTVPSGSGYLQLDPAPAGYDPSLPVTIDIFNKGVKGDVNGDGTVDVADLNLATDIILGLSKLTKYPLADVNGDGTVDVADTNIIINIILGL